MYDKCMVLTRSDKTKILLFALIIIALLALLPLFLPFYKDIEYFLSSSPLLGPLVYGLLMIGAILIAPIPASPLAIMAGKIFGPWQGMLYTLIAATLGAIIAFILARYFLGEVARNHLKSYTWYKKFSNMGEYKIAYLIALTRLMPQVSFDLVSYASGLTRIRLSFFALATFIGMIPIVFLLSFLGSFLQSYQEIILVVLLTLFIIFLTRKIKRFPKPSLSPQQADEVLRSASRRKSLISNWRSKLQGITPSLK